ncbi:MAG: hypothetical protein ACPGSB_10060, partial [Opitutales bacterium]
MPKKPDHSPKGAKNLTPDSNKVEPTQTTKSAKKRSRKKAAKKQPVKSTKKKATKPPVKPTVSEAEEDHSVAESTDKVSASQDKPA